MKNIIFFISIWILVGCSVTTTTPPISEYKISPKVDIDKEFKNGWCIKKSVKVSQAFGLGSVNTKNMKYVLDDYQEYSFTQSRWSVAPNKAITKDIVTLLRNSGLFLNVEGYKSRANTDIIIESSIDDFMQYFSKDETSSYVIVSITISIIDAKTSKVIKSNNFTIKKDVLTLNAKGGVKALNEALSIVLKDSINWIGKVCHDK